MRGFSMVHDVTDRSSSQAVVDRTVAEFGRIDILAHIAGVVQTAGLAEDLDVAEWDRVMSVNLKGPFLMTQAVVPVMRASRWGRIVIIGSYYGRHGVAYFTAYNSSKAGVISYASSLALEVADANITVNSVSPGMVNTEMHQGALQAEADNRGHHVRGDARHRVEQDAVQEGGRPRGHRQRRAVPRLRRGEVHHRRVARRERRRAHAVSSTPAAVRTPDRRRHPPPTIATSRSLAAR